MPGRPFLCKHIWKRRFETYFYSEPEFDLKNGKNNPKRALVSK